MPSADHRPPTVAEPVEIVPETQNAIEQFLFFEARLLDKKKRKEWLDLLADDLEYRVPKRVTRERSDKNEFSDDSFYFIEDKQTFEARVSRFDTEYAWSDIPPARERRFVSNVRPIAVDDDEFTVENNLVLYFGQGDTSELKQISGARRDTLRRTDDTFELAERTVFLDYTIVNMDKLSVFL